MNLSQLIEELGQFYIKYGDRPVAIASDGTYKTCRSAQKLFYVGQEKLVEHFDNVTEDHIIICGKRR